MTAGIDSSGLPHAPHTDTACCTPVPPNTYLRGCRMTESGNQKTSWYPWPASRSAVWYSWCLGDRCGKASMCAICRHEVYQFVSALYTPIIILASVLELWVLLKNMIWDYSCKSDVQTAKLIPSKRPI